MNQVRSNIMSAIEIVTNLSNLIPKMKPRLRKSSSLDKEIYAVITNIGELYQKLYDKSKKEETFKLRIHSGAKMTSILRKYYDNINRIDEEEFLLILDSIQDIVNRLFSHLQNEKIDIDLSALESDSTTHLKRATTLLDQLLNHIGLNKPSPEPCRKEQPYVESTSPNLWEQIQQKQKELSLTEYWNYELNELNVPLEEFPKIIAQRKEGMLNRYFPNLHDKDEIDKVWNEMNVTKFIKLPFTINELNKMSKEKLMEIGKRYFYDEYEGNEDIDDIRWEITRYLYSLEMQINVL